MFYDFGEIERLCRDSFYSYTVKKEDIFFRPIPRRAYWFPKYTEYYGGWLNSNVLKAWKYTSMNPEYITRAIEDIMQYRHSESITFYGVGTSAAFAWLSWLEATLKYSCKMEENKPQFRCCLIRPKKFIAQVPVNLPDLSGSYKTDFPQGALVRDADYLGRLMPGVLIVDDSREKALASGVPFDTFQEYRDKENWPDFKDIDQAWIQKISTIEG